MTIVIVMQNIVLDSTYLENFLSVVVSGTVMQRTQMILLQPNIVAYIILVFCIAIFYDDSQCDCIDL